MKTTIVKALGSIILTNEEAKTLKPVEEQKTMPKHTRDIMIAHEKSIKELGALNAIKVVKGSNLIIDGYHTWKKLIELGSDVRVEYVDVNLEDKLQLYNVLAGYQIKRKMPHSQQLAMQVKQVLSLSKSLNCTPNKAYQNYSGRKKTTRDYDTILGFGNSHTELFDIADNYGVTLYYLTKFYKLKFFYPELYYELISNISEAIEKIPDSAFDEMRYSELIRRKCKSHFTKILEDFKLYDNNLYEIYILYENNGLKGRGLDIKSLDQLLELKGYDPNDMPSKLPEPNDTETPETKVDNVGGDDTETPETKVDNVSGDDTETPETKVDSVGDTDTETTETKVDSAGDTDTETPETKVDSVSGDNIETTETKDNSVGDTDTVTPEIINTQLGDTNTGIIYEKEQEDDDEYYSQGKSLIELEKRQLTYIFNNDLIELPINQAEKILPKLQNLISKFQTITGKVLEVGIFNADLQEQFEKINNSITEVNLSLLNYTTLFKSKVKIQ
jgi:hypothetical protein